MKYFIALLLFFNCFWAFNQQGDGGSPTGLFYAEKLGKTIPVVYFNQPNLQKLRAEDRINDSLKIGPWRFGYNYDVNINLSDQALWLPTQDGGKVGLLRIVAANAQTINLTFSNTYIPEGNALYLYNPDQTMVLGKFTERHLYHGELGTELIPGNTTIVEYVIPPENAIGNIAISRVTYGYRTAEEYTKRVFGSSESCEMNVNCPDGAPYVKQRNSAVMLVVGSSGFCSGALINNTAYNGTPYVLTANHCTATHNNYASWIFRFKWQAPSCANPPSSPPFESLSGAVLRAKRSPSDFCLVEITGGLDNGTVPQNCTPYFAGWDRGNAAPPSAFCIHHPKGDITKISFDDDPPVVSQGMGSSEANSTWKVIWDRNTTTESSSSGSPLYNNLGQIIGQLWGGIADCSNTGTGYDFFGRIHNSWNPTGSNSTNQLAYWLDPSNSGDTSITGYDPYVTPSDYNAAINNIEGLDGAACQTNFYPKVRIQNKGNIAMTSLTIEYTYNNENTESMQWTGNLTTYQSTLVSLPPISNIEGQNHITVTVKNPNGQTDTVTGDNTFSIQYHASPNGTTLDFTFFMGCFPYENSWSLKDESGTELYAGTGSTTGSNANYFVRDTFCLKDGCYHLILKDTYGDGVAGSNYPNCDYDGSMTLVQENNGDTIAFLPSSEADFGKEKIFSFCINNNSETPSIKDLGVTGVRVYPNPNKGVFNVLTVLKGMKEVRLTNVSGQKIMIFSTEEQAFTIQQKQLAAGVYFLEVANDAKHIVRKIVVE